MLWTIAKGILDLLDGFFEVINRIWRYDFFNNEYVNQVFSGAIIVACSWLAIKVVIELIMNFIVRNDGRGSPLTIYRGIVLAIVMIFLVTPLFQFGHQFSTELTDSVISVSNLSNSGTAETLISKSLIKAMIYKNETSEDNANYFINNWKSVNINSTEGGFFGINDTYKYSINFFMLILLSLITIFLLFFVAIQMAKRVMEIALYKIVAPFCCTSLTNQSKSFEVWAKSTMGVFLITVVQFVCIGLLLTIFGSAFQETDTLTALFLVIGSLLFIITTPSLISALLNHQSGIMSGLGDIQSLMAISHVGGQGLGLAKAGTMGALSMGANVISRGSNVLTGGASNISRMLNRNRSLTSEQVNRVKTSIDNQNFYHAHNQVSDFIHENSKEKYQKPINNGFNQTYNMQYNPLKDKYTNINDRKSD